MKTRATNKDRPLWTVMFYFSGDNDLGPSMIQAMNALNFHDFEKHQLVFTIYYAPYSQFFQPSYYKLPEEVSPRASLSAASLKQNRGQRPSSAYLRSRVRRGGPPGNEQTLTSFINWSIRNHPSEHRMLVLSGHASGAIGEFLSAAHGASSRSGSGLTLLKLRSALAAATKESRKHIGRSKLFDIIGMDTCLMGMAEVCDVAKPYAEFLVASEGFVPEFGWPYEYLMRQFGAFLTREGVPGATNPNVPTATIRKALTSQLVSKYFVETFANYYDGEAAAGVSVDIAACDLSKLNEVKQSLRALSHSLCKQLREDAPKRDVIRDALIVAHWRAQSFNFELYTDLWDFFHELSESLRSGGYFSEVREACRKVKASIETMVTDQQSVGPDFQYSRGLSIYLPWSSPGDVALDNYEKLFANGKSDSPGWAAFLKSYLSATMREPREFSDNRLHVFKPCGANTTSRSDGSSRPGGLGTKHAPPYTKTSPLYNQLLSLIAPTLRWTMKNPQNCFSVSQELDVRSQGISSRK